MKKITPFLWFDNNAEEAMEFYGSIFSDSKVVDIMRYGDAGPGEPGSVMGGTFQLLGQEFMAINGGPQFSFTPAISFFVPCDTQAEIDDLWERLSDGGSKDQCGWLTDKFGVTWQIVPAVLGDLLGDPDPEKAQRTMEAMLKMTKLDIRELQEAHAGE
jgi:predicted 3-demethylubiquinone-9 3-methyltransferase (glyoxalase superfamily)